MAISTPLNDKVGTVSHARCDLHPFQSFSKLLGQQQESKSKSLTHYPNILQAITFLDMILRSSYSVKPVLRDTQAMNVTLLAFYLKESLILLYFICPFHHLSYGIHNNVILCLGICWSGWSPWSKISFTRSSKNSPSSSFRWPKLPSSTNYKNMDKTCHSTNRSFFVFVTHKSVP